MVFITKIGGGGRNADRQGVTKQIPKLCTNAGDPEPRGFRRREQSHGQQSGCESQCEGREGAERSVDVDFQQVMRRTAQGSEMCSTGME